MKNISIILFLFILFVLCFIFVQTPIFCQEDKSGEPKVNEDQDPSIAKIKINDLSFKDRKLSFQISDYQIQKADDKQIGWVQIRIRILDLSDQPFFDQSKKLKTLNKEMSISLPFSKLPKGNYKISINAIDLFTNKSAVAQDSVTLSEITPNQIPASEFSISYSWTQSNKCENGRSPKIFLKNVPDDTKSFKIKVIDLDLRSFDHGGGIVRYKGKDYIRSGALRNYYGPCPPPGVTHKYSIVVQAVNSKNKVTGTAEYIQACSN